MAGYSFSVFILQLNLYGGLLILCIYSTAKPVWRATHFLFLFNSLTCMAGYSFSVFILQLNLYGGLLIFCIYFTAKPAWQATHFLYLFYS